MDVLFALTVSIILCYSAGIIYSLMVYWIDRFEKEPKILIGVVFLWGALVAIFGSLIIEVIFDAGIETFSPSEFISDIIGGSISAPFAEEIMKSSAVFLIFLLFRKEFDSILDGVIYASITALGFAATENTLYVFGNYSECGWNGLFGLFFIRVILCAWGHPLFTAFTGIGLAIARNNRNPAIKVFAPLTGLSLGMLLHGLANGMLVVMKDISALAGKITIEWAGWFVILAIMLLALVNEKHSMIQYLKEEVDNGLITLQQYTTACSLFKQFSAGIKSAGRGRLKSTHRFYQLCAELAQKKKQLAHLGEEGGNSQIISQLREELALLNNQVVV
jgi:RsiW-degrading membrane proteinase PrsW (M82 family)